MEKMVDVMQINKVREKTAAGANPPAVAGAPPAPAPAAAARI
jgi:hypothetical protein